MKDIDERFIEILKDTGESLYKVSEKAGLIPAQLYDIKKGKSSLTALVWERFTKAYNYKYSSEYVFTGKGQMITADFLLIQQRIDDLEKENQQLKTEIERQKKIIDKLL